VIAEGRLGPRARSAMSAVFDKEARQEYLDAIRFYGKGAERFSDALAACVQKIQASLSRFLLPEPLEEMIMQSTEAS
jgi:hypothetical protein